MVYEWDQMLARHWKLLLCSFIGILILSGFFLSQGPDLDLRLQRDLPSDLSIQDLGHSIQDLTTWPKWFYATDSAEALDLVGRPYAMKDQTATPGEVIRINIDPKKGQAHKFVIMTRVLEFIPNQKLKLEVTGDSHDRLKKLFDRIVWTIEIAPWTEGPLRNGKLPISKVTTISEVHTCHWRSRFFGRIAEKILLNQTFYPNILALSGLELPSEPGIVSPSDN
jgi:hypothetical protein